MSAYSFSNGENQLSVRTKLNNLGNDFEGRIVNRSIAALTKNSEVPEQVIFTAGELNTWKKIPANLSAFLLDNFEATTYGVKYTGASSRYFAFDGGATIGTSSANTVVDFRLAINGVTQPSTQSEVKIATSTDRSTITACNVIELQPEDIVEIYCTADTAGTVSAYHTQIRLIEVK